MIIRNVIDENNVTYNAGRVFQAKYLSVEEGIMYASCPTFEREMDAIIMIEIDKAFSVLQNVTHLTVKNSSDDSMTWAYGGIIKVFGNKSYPVNTVDLQQRKLLLQYTAIQTSGSEMPVAEWVLLNARTYPDTFNEPQYLFKPWSFFGLYIDDATGEIKTSKEDEFYVFYEIDPESGEKIYKVIEIDPTGVIDWHNGSWTVVSGSICQKYIGTVNNILTFI